MSPKTLLRIGSHLSVIVGLGVASAQTTIYQHTFNEGAGNLNTTPVDTGTGSWVAADVVTANGVFSTGPGSATLAFTPSQGTQYQLDATITGVTGDGNWVALGFAGGPGLAGAGTPGQSTSSNTNARFTTQSGVDVEGRAWMMARGTNSTTFNRAFTQGSSGSAEDWAGPTSLTQSNGGDFDFRILLDTTGGAGTWTATWFAKRPTDGTYTEVRSAFLLPNEDITSVGFAFSTGATDGTLQSFSLTQIALSEIAGIAGIEFDVSGNVVLTLDGPADGLTVQQSDNLVGFSDIPSTASGNTLTIDAADVDPNADGKDFYRVRN